MSWINIAAREKVLVMKQRVKCPECGHSKLDRIRVKGIKKCTQCGSLVDVRGKNWLTNLLSA